MQKIDKKNRVEWYFKEKNSTIKQLKKEVGNKNDNYGQPINSQEKKTKINEKHTMYNLNYENLKKNEKIIFIR